MKKWNIQYKNAGQKSKVKSQKLDQEEIVEILLENRGVKGKVQVEKFLDPQLEDVTVESVGIDKKELKKALNRIGEAIEKDEQVIIFGDYDVDGICGTTILWETLYALHKKTMPYIPHRMDEGYGLSVRAIDNILVKYPDTKLIITVDNGVVATEAVKYANSKKIDVIITDHHVGGQDFPPAHAVVHTTKLCGSGVAYLLTKEISNFQFQISNSQEKNAKTLPSKMLRASNSQVPAPRSLGEVGSTLNSDSHLELAAIATIADLVPLTDGNRTIVKEGIKCVQKTTRVGLLALYKDALVEKEKIGVYEIGHIICPRINAMGRLTSGMDSLRLLCARTHERAAELAQVLSTTNRDRQGMTEESAVHAIGLLADSIGTSRIAFVAHQEYNQGVIGLIASKLVEEYYRPAFAISIGEKLSKGSARSISGVNIIEMIRSVSHTLVQAGGHPMAAGFTVETGKLEEFRLALEAKSLELVTDDHLVRSLKIDCVIPFSIITKKLYTSIQALAPFGMGNPEPTFVSNGVTIENATPVGREQKHIKLKVSQEGKVFDAIAFGFGKLRDELQVGKTIDIAYTIDENTWQGKTTLQLKVKDIKLGQENN